jgi:hypothetical protein
MSFETKILKNGLNKFDVGDIVIERISRDIYKIIAVYNDTVYSVIKIDANKFNKPGIADGGSFRATPLRREVILEKWKRN